jgi:hypothetical protein
VWLAGNTLEAIEKGACPVCSQILSADGTCPNWLCDDPRRRIQRIDAIAYLSGALRRQIHRYKYEGKTARSLIFGRLVVGWLEAHATASAPDLIVANPTFPGPTDPDNAAPRIIESAAIEDAEERWPFDTGNEDPAIIKTGPTEKSAGRTAAAEPPPAARDPRSAADSQPEDPRLRRCVHDRKPVRRRRRLPARRRESSGLRRQARTLLNGTAVIGRNPECGSRQLRGASAAGPGGPCWPAW